MLLREEENIIKNGEWNMLINSLLDTDLYSFSVMQIAFNKYPTLTAKYKFKCRNDINLLEIKEPLKKEISGLCKLIFQSSEIEYLKSLGYFKSDFLNYLKEFRLNPTNIAINEVDNNLDITIKGNWVDIILFEIPILAIVNELYFQSIPIDNKICNWGVDRLNDKINLIQNISDFKFADFGTRRRYSFNWQENVIQELSSRLPNNFVGTSNTFFAMKYGLKPIGTMSHQYLQAFQAIVHPRHSQKEALEVWSQEYDGQLGIALTDVINMDAFLNDFSLKNAKLYDGLRHDSGDPIEWGHKAIDFYKKMGINPKEKTLVFSDGLSVPKALTIHEHFAHTINVSFGIGTNLTNDVGFVPLNIVIKMVECDGLPVAKISDSPGKSMCKDISYMEYLKNIFKVKEV